MEREYISEAPPTVRVKLIYVEEAKAEVSLSDSELARLPELAKAFERAREESRTGRYPAQFERLNPEPTILNLDIETASEFVELIKEKGGTSLYEKAVTLETSLGKYIVAVEHSCG
ncbi:hypothetical protein HRbin01_00197 [archaeon HR01]|nr:hypothetical protein HRbin01_00197 [archaeon HR01]